MYTKKRKVERQCDSKHGTHQCDIVIQISKEKYCVFFGRILRSGYGQGTE
jgi:hypothetical protein